ncbi:glycosyltransferase family 2 protein [Empedobacter falsenii]|uniref:glycosyltransferase family 2 protein n=1 Tax=Empedobacter TaxID=59734 RepID=UPI00244918D9|nr:MULTISPECIES: glycosyltransferase family 2 protein [Empedobacter]MDH0672967.1 glycosyltransferase family 2 protein [Empedobacter sp. GD03861]MDH1881872.1 glycosyltransferase family 2 protein [Empedobacter sp. GD03797]MDM1062673.1 glycosyltransferase family 2 protein [Empedobacter falsenii]MDM1297450.1 glycosyltransferase family 2 protein [Empedobacter falsenii]MDM1317244.1 glycosyltransferase family 2 protein [Empedobacter falsenii]
MSTEFTIIIPIYNEEDNLIRLEETMNQYLSKSIKQTEILLINDGSKDKSLALIKEICNRNQAFHYISFDKNYGLSAAIKAGFDTVESKWVGYIDADLQTDPEDFNKLLALADQYDLVTGVRADRKDSFVKNMSSKIANSIRRAFTNDGMDDTGCPLKVIDAEKAKKIPMFKGLHRFLPAMILLQNGTVTQVPVKHFPRIAGESKFNLWNRLLGPLMDCFAFVWMKKKYINYKIQERA